MQMKQSNDCYQFICFTPYHLAFSTTPGLLRYNQRDEHQHTDGTIRDRTRSWSLSLISSELADGWMDEWMDVFGLHVGGYSQWSTHGIIRICSSMSLTHCLGSLQSPVECTLNPGLRVRKTAYTIHHETVFFFLFFLFSFFVMDRTGSRVYSRFLLFFTSESCT